ncbi:MAG: hypothetical protein IT210_04790 [Armatimonadetes bacterium]|nr:hypothetical protein [Armatimonadota bacterium]
MKRRRGRAIAGLLLLAAGAVEAQSDISPPSKALPEPAGNASIRLTRYRKSGEIGLKAVRAPMKDIASTLERATGCAIEMDKELQEGRHTLDISPRPAEKLFHALARRVAARIVVTYRLKHLLAGETAPPGNPLFAGRQVSVNQKRPEEPEILWQQLGITVEMEEDIVGKVVLTARKEPLARALDRAAAQLQARWETVLRLEPRFRSGESADPEEEMRDHFTDLAKMTSKERQEEIRADISAIESLPEDRQEAGVLWMAGNVTGLASLLKSVPGEHRERVALKVAAVAQDYWNVMDRLPPSSRARFDPVCQALLQLQKDYADIGNEESGEE